MITKANEDIANRKHTYLSYGNVNCTSRALSSAEDINLLCDVYRRRKVEWIIGLSDVACNSVPVLTLLSGSTPPEKNPLSLCGGESLESKCKVRCGSRIKPKNVCVGG